MPEKYIYNTNSDLSELSEVWLELLGQTPSNGVQMPEQATEMPMVNADPWNDLLHTRGIEEINLQQVQLRVSDQEVEQVLEMMQEDDADSKDWRHRS